MVNKTEVDRVEQRMVDVPGAAVYLGCGKRQIDRLVRTGEVPTVRYSDGARPKRYIPVEALDRFLAARMAKARADADPHITNERYKAIAKKMMFDVKNGN